MSRALVGRRDVVAGAFAAGALPAANPRVVIVTEAGALVIEMYVDRAPLSARDFLHYVDAGAYDGGAFFRVVRPGNDRGLYKIDVVQGRVRPHVVAGPPVAHEGTDRTGLRHLDGVVSLTRDAPGTGSGSEFFVCVGDQPELDAGGRRNPDGQGYAAFGRVVSGMETVRKIWQMEAEGISPSPVTAGQILTHPVRMMSAKRN